MGLISRVSSRTYRNAMKLISSICIGDVSAGRSRLEPAPKGERLVRLLFENTREEGRLNVHKFRIYRQRNRGRERKILPYKQHDFRTFQSGRESAAWDGKQTFWRNLDSNYNVAWHGRALDGELYLGACWSHWVNQIH